jgi:hypothetical protein
MAQRPERKIGGPGALMKSECLMCGREIAEGFLCDKCDKPRKQKTDALPKAPPAPAAPSPVKPVVSGKAAEPPAPAPSASSPSGAIVSGSLAADPFPKAPVVPFPIESASPALTSICEILAASGMPAVILGPDKSVKWTSDAGRKLFGIKSGELLTLKFIEMSLGSRIDSAAVGMAYPVSIRGRNVTFSLVPISGGASGCALIFRPAELMNESHASFIEYVRETILSPLRALRDSFVAVSKTRGANPLLADSVATLDGILSSLEMAPEVEEPFPDIPTLPTAADVVRRVADRFMPFAELKSIQVQVDVPELSETFRDYDQLDDALGFLMENALHYVPPRGQVVVGLRWMEHKGKPLLLFFVMDNGPVVPEALRQEIFNAEFVWNPNGRERTGRNLNRVREFATGHGGSVWVESKTGKACTFFLRVRTDSQT